MMIPVPLLIFPTNNVKTNEPISRHIKNAELLEVAEVRRQSVDMIVTN